jgi:hypothetical protein
MKPDRSDIDMVRYSLSLARCWEEFKIPPEYLTDTITNKSSSEKDLIDDICSFIDTWPGVNILPELKPGNFVLSNKAGPNGPATLTCLQDLAALRGPGQGRLYDSVKEMLKISIPFLELSNYDTSSMPKGIHSKLVLLQDKFGKTRVIAIADYFSNLALSCIHKSFMYALQRMRGDVTYLQNEIPNLIKGLGDHLYSSDMTAFTDRFPIELETHVIKAAYGERISQLWRSILTDRLFYHPLGSVKYEVGNPMGVLSSWPVSTFTHHVVKRYCAYKMHLKDYEYLILGDDTLDTDKGVYDLYLSVIKRLGVSISESKCTQSTQGYAEFAKRLFTPNGECTGLPIHILDGVNKYPEQVIELYRICISRGYNKSFLAPGFEALIRRNKYSKVLADIFSLPKHVTGFDPLWEPKTGTWAEHFVSLEEGKQLELLRISRESLLWDIINNIDSVAKSKPTSDLDLSPNHPLIFALSESIERYLPEEAYSSDFEEDEFWIYDQWMKGEYIHLVNIPNVDTYRFYNRGHRVTKCNFDIFKRLLELSNGNENIPLHPRTRRTNDELYNIALGRIDPR